ncbi:MAG: SBBP repeat-containing protein [Coriobacteriia bacterium]
MPEGPDLHDFTDTAVPVAAVAKRKGLTPRKAFMVVAIFLAVLLVALLVYILLLMSDKSLLDVFEGGDRPPGVKPLFAIEGPGTGDHPTFDRPLGVAYGPDGRIYVADTGNNRVCVFDGDGEFLFEFGGFGVLKPAPGVQPTWDAGEFNFPAGIDCDEAGNVYVADFHNDQIQMFDADGEFIRAFPSAFEPVGLGSSGEGGKGIAVTDVAARAGYVYATDRYQVFVFTTEGEFVRQFGKPGNGPGDLDHPNGIAVGEDGTIYVSDSNHNRVSAFTQEGEPIWNLGRIPEGMQDTAEREFGLPRGLAVMDDGNVLVVDAFDFVLVRVSPDGKILSSHGERGVELGQFNFPNDVDVSGDRVVVADKENDRVQVLELVEE